MPKGTYGSIEQAEKNAKKILSKTRCDAIKIESNKKNFNIIRSLVKKKNCSYGTHWLHTPV